MKINKFVENIYKKKIIKFVFMTCHKCLLRGSQVKMAEICVLVDFKDNIQFVKKCFQNGKELKTLRIFTTFFIKVDPQIFYRV